MFWFNEGSSTKKNVIACDCLVGFEFLIDFSL